MARQTLFTHRKFLRLALALKSRALACGSLELLWNVAYQSGDPVIGAVAEVEFAADWKGKPGVLASALVESGFLDRSETGELSVHHLYDHAPEYVKKRMDREDVRSQSGKSIRDVRSEAAKKRWHANGNHLDTNGMQTGITTTANGTPPSPTPTPSPSPTPTQEEQEGDRGRIPPASPSGTPPALGAGREDPDGDRPGKAEISAPAPTSRRKPATYTSTLDVISEAAEYDQLLALWQPAGLTAVRLDELLTKSESVYVAKGMRRTRRGVLTWCAHFVANEMARRASVQQAPPPGGSGGPSRAEASRMLAEIGRRAERER